MGGRVQGIVAKDNETNANRKLKKSAKYNEKREPNRIFGKGGKTRNKHKNIRQFIRIFWLMITTVLL